MSKEEALKLAEQYGLRYEVEACILEGCTPEEALREWDII